MLRSKLLLIGLVFISGCASVPQIETVTKVERIVVRPPPELLNIPPQPMAIDIDNATQRTVAQWLLQSEGRSQQMEDQLKALQKFYQEVK